MSLWMSYRCQLKRGGKQKRRGHRALSVAVDSPAAQVPKHASQSAPRLLRLCKMYRQLEYCDNLATNKVHDVLCKSTMYR